MQTQEATSPPAVVQAAAVTKPKAVFRRYGRHWSVYEGDNLICITVYKRGAVRLVERLEEHGEEDDAV